MLSSLSVKNFALIEHLEIQFSENLSIITGETGAGKSILLGALGLVLGKRADLTSLKDKEQKCIIEANFLVKNYKLQSFFEENDIDYEDNTIIRREILPSGKSRAFVNDTPINLAELELLGNQLIDIHSQHQTRSLTEEDFQFEIIDAVAQNQELLTKYKVQLADYKKEKSALKKLETEKDSLAKEAEYNSFLLQELLDAKLQSGEQTGLEQELEQLNNVEAIKESLSKVLQLSEIDEIGLISQLKEIKISSQKIASISNDYQEVYTRIESVLIEFQDIISDVNNLTEKVIDNPERLEEVNQKLQLIYQLQKKHQVNSVEDLLLIQEQLDEKVFKADSINAEIEKLKISIENKESELNQICDAIAKNRLAAIPDLSFKMSEILSLLGMPNAQFNIELSQSDDFLYNGKNTLQWLFSANKGSSFGLMKKVASGGEMSRIMLALKSILANYSKLPTIIFDEIDTGVSGEIANKMGEIMKNMSQKMQVFAITHLPQIAAKGNQHYKVYKTEIQDTTISELKLLNSDERIIEIAEMLSGKDISDSALTHAKDLLKFDN